MLVCAVPYENDLDATADWTKLDLVCSSQWVSIASTNSSMSFINIYSLRDALVNNPLDLLSCVLRALDYVLILVSYICTAKHTWGREEVQRLTSVTE